MRSSSAACLVAAALVVALASSAAPVGAVVVKIMPQTEECFSDVIKPGGTLTMAFAVTHGGQKDIDALCTISVVDTEALEAEQHAATYEEQFHTKKSSLKAAATTHDKELSNLRQVVDGSCEIVADEHNMENAHYPVRLTVCFGNKMAKFTPKWVSFQFFKMDEPESHAKELTEAEAALEHSIHKEAVTVHGAMTDMVRIMRSEQEHRNTVEATNAWILYGTLVNGVLLVVMSFFQFWFLKRYLSVRPVTRII